MTQLKKITQRHSRMLEALVLGGKTQKSVCEEFGISETRLSTLRKCELWRKEEQRLSSELKAQYITQLQSLVPKAIEALEETVGREMVVEGSVKVLSDPKARISASKEILNRAGIRGEEDSGSGSVVIQLYAPGYATDDGVGKIIDVEVGGAAMDK